MSGRGGFLLDTSALSSLAPSRSGFSEAVAARLRDKPDRLHLSTITLAEIREGICKLRRKGAAGRADALEGWFATLRYGCGERILPFGIEEAEVSGDLADCAVGIGRNPGFADVAIAGTAKAHGLTVITENVRHFEPLTAFGVSVTNFADMIESG